jgi:hypothetical protein
MKIFKKNLFKKKKPIFHLEYLTSQDVINYNIKSAKQLKDKSDYIFNDEILYKTKGCGHSFMHGFFHLYLTKSGISAEHFYLENKWLINNEFYELIDNKFVLIPREPIQPFTGSFENLSFPLIKSILPKNIDLISVQPMKLPDENI